MRTRKVAVTPKDIVYAFIDSQNLNLGTSKDLYNVNGKKIYTGWKLDFKKFYRYLKDKFRIKKAFLFIGYIRNNYKLYHALKSYGYELVFKPTVKGMHGRIKGNVDAELVLYSAKIEYDNYTKGVFVSGDGDFACLYKELEKDGKLFKIIIPNRKAMSSLLKPYEKFKVYIAREKSKLEYKGGGRGVSPRR